MYKLVTLASFVASAAAVADPIQAYAGGLGYGHAYNGYAGAFPGHAALGYAAGAFPGHAGLGYAAGVAPYAGLGYAAGVAPAAYAAAAPAIPAAYAAGLPAPQQLALPQPLTVLPVDHATSPHHIAYAVPAAAAPIPSPGLGLPEAAHFIAPQVYQVPEAPIVEHTGEAVEQWGYKVAY